MRLGSSSPGEELGHPGEIAVKEGGDEGLEGGRGLGLRDFYPMTGVEGRVRRAGGREVPLVVLMLKLRGVVLAKGEPEPSQLVFLSAQERDV